MQAIDISPVRQYLLDLQDRICEGLEKEDGTARFLRQSHDGERGGLARPRVLSGGPVIEKAAVNFSHTSGERMPGAATERRPELAGASFEAASVSLIVHPVNPFVPTTHANVRCFIAHKDGQAVTWWFGGGFDLTPYFGFEEDAVHWHRVSKTACDPFGDDVYARHKAACDEYFFLKHRGEARGIGGLFFDDLQEPDFETCFAFMRSVGDHFLPAYLPIVQRRKDHPWGDEERQFQLRRRGRYVEFNLLYDRGTRFGLQASGKVESILASLPPLVSWHYQAPDAPISAAESNLMSKFLKPRDWLGLEADGGTAS